MNRRTFEAHALRQRREAELFFADLTGGASGEYAEEAAAGTQRAADEFLAELLGESIGPLVVRPRTLRAPHPQRRGAEALFVPGADFAEQPAPAAAPMPSPIAVNWAGVDRSHTPQADSANHPIADPIAWMGTLIDNSNLRFTGAYVTGPPLAGHPAAHFTGSSKAVARGWMPNIQALADEGWGLVFFYVGYSVGGGHPKPAVLNRARGTEHGLHLRTTMHALGPAWAGATVFIDNEDPVATNLPNDLIEYYVAMFEEMSRPDPNLAAFRPAFYGHGTPVEQMLARRRDLFVWDVWLSTATTTTATPAFDVTQDPLTVDPVTRPMRAYRSAAGGGAQFLSWSLGRQFWYYTGEMPAPGSALATRLPAWPRVPTWDYDGSLVRNAAFPAGEPRVAARRHRTDAVVLGGFFEPRVTGAAPAPAASRVMTQGPAAAAAAALPRGGGVRVEPDAPLTLFPRGSDMLMATVLSDGGLGVATRNAAGTWTAIDHMPGTAPVLRRLRALHGVSNALSHTHLFSIGSDHRPYVKRWQRSGTWSDGEPLAAELRLHPFSALAGEARRGDTVDVFFIDEQGLLTTAYWARWFTTAFPGFLVQRLETTPSLLPGGALAAVCPQPDHLLVFGVGADLRLQSAAFLHNRGWNAVTALGGPQDLIGAHSKLAAHAVSTTEIEVAALTDSGQLAVYSLTLAGTTWAAAARQVVADPPPAGGAAAAAAGRAVLRPANGFRINPFGDLSIVRAPGERVSSVVCAGVRGTDTRALRWNAAGPAAWQVFA